MLVVVFATVQQKLYTASDKLLFTIIRFLNISSHLVLSVSVLLDITSFCCLLVSVAFPPHSHPLGCQLVRTQVCTVLLQRRTSTPTERPWCAAVVRSTRGCTRCCWSTPTVLQSTSDTKSLDASSQ